MIQRPGQVRSITRLAAAIARAHNLHRHAAIGYVGQDARGTVHWHPDRPVRPSGIAFPVSREPVTAVEVQRWLDGAVGRPTASAR
jgi:hypothetical protein